MNFEKQFKESIDSFNFYVKKPLQKMLNAKIISIEENSDSRVSNILDQKASTDLILEYENDNCIYLAMNRVLNINSKNINDCEINITLRNSINNNYEITEINKLKKAYDNIKNNIPTVMPKVITLSRIIKLGKEKKLLDLIVIEIMPLIEFIFSEQGLNLSILRYKYENSHKTIYFNKEDKLLAGIRKTSDKKATFLYINKKLLDKNEIPYKFISNKKELEDEIILENTQIQYESRYNKQSEIGAMKNFILEIEKENLNHYIFEVFFNSKSSICTFIINEYIERTKNIEKKIIKIALNYFFQFEIFNKIIVNHELIEKTIEELES